MAFTTMFIIFLKKIYKKLFLYSLILNVYYIISFYFFII